MGPLVCLGSVISLEYQIGFERQRTGVEGKKQRLGSSVDQVRRVDTPPTLPAGTLEGWTGSYTTCTSRGPRTVGR